MCYKGNMKQPTHIRLNPEEEARIDRVREALSQRLSGAPVTKTQVIHALLAKGYEVLAKELGLEN